MSWLKSIAREVFGLFVDDLTFAGAILFWLAIVIFVLPQFASSRHWGAAALFAGMALILIESVLRFARRRSK